MSQLPCNYCLLSSPLLYKPPFRCCAIYFHYGVSIYITSIYLHGDLGSPHRSLPFLDPTCQGTNAYKHCAECDLDFCSTCCMSECPMPLGLNSFEEKVAWDWSSKGLVRRWFLVCVCIYCTVRCMQGLHVSSSKCACISLVLVFLVCIEKRNLDVSQQTADIEESGTPVMWCL